MTGVARTTQQWACTVRRQWLWYLLSFALQRRAALMRLTVNVDRSTVIIHPHLPLKTQFISVATHYSVPHQYYLHFSRRSYWECIHLHFTLFFFSFTGPPWELNPQPSTNWATHYQNDISNRMRSQVLATQLHVPHSNNSIASQNRLIYRMWLLIGNSSRSNTLTVSWSCVIPV